MNIELNSQHLAPRLAAKNIFLRPAKISDYAAIRTYRQDVENCRYIRPPESNEVTMEIVQQLEKPWSLTLGHWNGFVICLQEDHSLVGEIVFRIDDWQNQRAEIGYRVSEKATGRGLCTEAANLLIDYLFKELGFFKLVARCDPRNVASFRVMEKLGFQREAFFKQHYLMGEQWTDQVDYGLIVTDWRRL